eukprot:749017-Hanusia_phi.AAC.2
MPFSAPQPPSSSAGPALLTRGSGSRHWGSNGGRTEACPASQAVSCQREPKAEEDPAGQSQDRLAGATSARPLAYLVGKFSSSLSVWLPCCFRWMRSAEEGQRPWGAAGALPASPPSPARCSSCNVFPPRMSYTGAGQDAHFRDWQTQNLKRDFVLVELLVGSVVVE